MTISYPLNLPDVGRGPSRIRLKYKASIANTQNPYNYRVLNYIHDGQIWLADVDLPTLTPDQAGAWEAFLASLNGTEGTFWLYDTSRPEPMGVLGGSPVIDGDDQTGQSINTRGWSVSTQGVLKMGDPIQIGNFYHKVLTDVDSDASGNATIDIFPKLRQVSEDDQPIITSTPKGLFTLNENSVIIHDSRADRNKTISFSAVEAI